MNAEEHFIQSIINLFERDINKLETEINSYRNESLIWTTAGEIKNPAGNLCLHLCGNLQHYIGAVLGNTGYVRNRDLEFSAKGVSQKNLVTEIQKTKEHVLSTLNSIQNEALVKEYPAQVFDYSMTTMHFLIHLESHLNYHLGQINYHRRLIDK
jgi:hypothetical protein